MMGFDISKPIRRNLGRPWCKTSLACCCDQGWKEARPLPDRQVSTKGTEKTKIEAVTLVTMELIAQIALGVIIGGLTIALLVTGFFVWNSRQRNERLALGLFIAGAVLYWFLLLWSLVTRKAAWQYSSG